MLNCTVCRHSNNSLLINTKTDIGVKVFVHLCFHSNGGGPPGGGVPVHHHPRGDRPAAFLSGPEPDLPVRSTIMEETSQPHEGEDDGKPVCVCVCVCVRAHSAVFV